MSANFLLTSEFQRITIKIVAESGSRQIITGKVMSAGLRLLIEEKEC